jgi:hypothetical protein
VKTEVTIDEATAACLQAAAALEHITFNQALDRAIIVGVSHIQSNGKSGPYKMRTHRLGKRLDDPRIVADLVESSDERHFRQNGG